MLQARRIAKVADQLPTIIEAQNLRMPPIASVQLDKTCRRDGQHTEEPMRLPAGITKRAYDLLRVDSRRLGHRLRHPVQRDVETGEALRAYWQVAEKAMHRECGIQEEAQERGRRLSARRHHTRHDGGERARHVNTKDFPISREIPMNAGLSVSVAADELALFVDTQDQSVGHENVVDGDIHLETVQVRGEAGTEKPMARARDIQKISGHLSRRCDGLDLCRHSFGTMEPEVQRREKWGCAQRIYRRRAEQTMRPLSIAESADQLSGARDAMKFSSGGVGTIHGYYGQL